MYAIRSYYVHLAKYERPVVVAEELVLKATRDNLGRLRAWLLDPVAERLSGKRLVIVPEPLSLMPGPSMTESR